MYNGHGDVTALLTTDGQIPATYYYDAFGNIIEQTVTGGVYQPVKYAGYYFDDETGLYYLNARYYDPKIARFLSEDTNSGNPNDPLSLNLYTYCQNEPIMYVDPDGHSLLSVIGSIVGSIIESVSSSSSSTHSSHSDNSSRNTNPIARTVSNLFGVIRDLATNKSIGQINLFRKDTNQVEVMGFSGFIDKLQLVGTRYADYSINGMANNLQELTELAIQYKQETGVSTPTNELVLQYIRRGEIRNPGEKPRYTDGSWPAVAGAIDTDFVKYVNENASELKGYFNDNVVIKDPLTNSNVDFVHWAATLNGLLYDTKWKDAGYQSLIGEENIDNLCGWAGDLQQFEVKVIKLTKKSNDYAKLYATASDLMGDSSSAFAISDVLADIDAFNIKNRLDTSSLVDAFKEYYSEGNKTRYADFTENMSKEGIRGRAGRYTDNFRVWPKKWPIFERAGVDPSNNQSRAVRDAYTHFMVVNVRDEKIRNMEDYLP